jgi:hypothetical protein
MPEPRDEASRPAVLSKVVGLASVPVTQTSLAYGGLEDYDVFYPDSAASGSTPNATMGWYATGRADAMTDISESFIKVTGYYHVKANLVVPSSSGDPVVTYGVSATTPPFLSSALFNDVQITLNGTVAMQTQGDAQPYSSLASVIRSESYSDRMTGDYTKGYILDNPGTSNVTGVTSLTSAAIPNTGGFDRQALYIGVATAATPGKDSTRQFSTTVRLADLGFRCHSWLPPNVQMRIRARRAKNNFLIQGDATDLENCAPADIAGAKSPVFTITAANLYMSRKRLDESALMSLNSWWLSNNAKVPYTKIQTSVNFFSAATTSITLNNQLAGKTPDCVYAFLVGQQAYKGDSAGADPAFFLAPNAHTAWLQVAIQVGGGRTYPIQPVVMQTSDGALLPYPSLDLAEIYQMYRATCNRAPFLKASDFTNIQPICFQIGSRSDGAWDLAEDTAIAFKGTLSAAMAKDYALILVSFTDTVMSFAASGQVVAY